MGWGGLEPKMALVVDVLPGVNGMVSPSQIMRLYGALDYVLEVRRQRFLGP